MCTSDGDGYSNGRFMVVMVFAVAAAARVAVVIVLRMGIVMVSNRGHSIIVLWWCIRLS